MWAGQTLDDRREIIYGPNFVGSEIIAMYSLIRNPFLGTEFMTNERCHILEVWNDTSDSAVSIARARVSPGVTTQLHRLNGVDERYLIVQGEGEVLVGDLAKQAVRSGNVVVIPKGTPQQITNLGESDLIFYCICSPRFSPDCYESIE
jgi:mannose-6-phosphate isomerase-like protein (cupin superfamily)